MTEDQQFLTAFLENGSEPAFEALVERHAGMIYSAALRQVNGDVSMAEDITQAVIIHLYQKADQLRNRKTIAGWLHTATRFAAANAVRGERRRREREKQSHTDMSLGTPEPKEAVEPDLITLLDEAMHDLGEGEREMVVLRYFEKTPLAKIGELTGVSEDAARMRIDRVVEKLRSALTRRGATVGTVALAAALSNQTAASIPAGLVTTACAAALSTTLGTTVTATSGAAATSLLKTVLAAMAAAGIATVALHLRHQSQQDEAQRQILELQETNGELMAKGAALESLVAYQTNELRQLRRDTTEIHRLRGLVGEMRGTLEDQANRLNEQESIAKILKEAEDLLAGDPANSNDVHGAFLKRQRQKMEIASKLNQLYHSLANGQRERFPLLMEQFEEYLKAVHPDIDPDLLPSHFQLVFTNSPSDVDLNTMHKVPFLIERTATFREEAIHVEKPPDKYVWTRDGIRSPYALIRTPEEIQYLRALNTDPHIDIVPYTRTNHIQSGWERLVVTLPGGMVYIDDDAPQSEPPPDARFMEAAEKFLSKLP